MNTNIKVLIIEDSVEDVRLIINELQSNNFNLFYKRVETENELKSLLEKFNWDLIFADYYLPTFTCPDAFKIVKEFGCEAPFIIISGKIDEELANEQMKIGATDFVSKNNLSRLSAIVKRELEREKCKHEKMGLERKLFSKQKMYKQLFESNPIPMWIFDFDTLKFLAVNNKAVERYGYLKEEFLNMTIKEIRPAEDIPALISNLDGTSESFVSDGIWRHKKKNGEIINVEIFTTRILYENRFAKLVIANDITEQHKKEKKLEFIDRAHTLISKINKLIVQNSDKQTLFSLVCKALVEEGKYNLAWLGACIKESGILVPVASMGENAEDISNYILRCKEDEDLANPIAKCIKEDKFQVSHSSLAKSVMSYLQCTVTNFGFPSFMCLPVKVKDEVIGSLNIYSSEQNFFNDDEIRILQEVVNDLSFALDKIELELKKVKIENKLTINQYNFDLISKNTNDLICVTDLEGKFIYVSPSYKTVRGYESEELIGTYSLELVHNDDRQKVGDALKEIIKTLLPKIIEFRTRKKNGEFIYIESSVNIALDAIGNPVNFISVAKDISEKVKTLQQLKESEKKTRLILENMIELIATVDLNGNYTFLNPSYKKVLGYEPDEMIGKNAFDLFHPDEIPEITLRMKNMIEQRTEVFTIHKIKDASGNWRIFESKGNVLIDDNDVITGIIVSSKDITEKIQAEEKLKEKEQSYSSIFNNAHLGIYRTTPDGKILLANPSLVEMLGFNSFEELAERNLEQNGFVDEYPREYFKSQLETENKLKKYESVWKKRDGTSIIVYENAISVRDENNNVIYYEGTVEDITERKISENKIIENEKRLQLALDGTNAGLWDWNLTTNEIYRDDNLLRMLGYTRDEISNNLDFWRQITHPDDLNKVQELFENHIAGKSEFYNAEFREKTKSGEYIWIHDKGKIVERDENEKPIRMTGTATNISDRKKVELQLKIFTKAIEQSPVSILITDIDGNIEYVNPSFTKNTGYSVKESLKRNPKFLSSGKTSKKTFEELWKTIKTGNQWKGEICNKKKNGEIIWESVIITPLFDDKGKIVHYLGIQTDITDKRIYEDLIIKSEYQFRTIWNSSFDAMRLTDDEGFILRVNDAFCNLFEKQREEIEWNNFNVVYSINDYEQSIERYKQNFKTGNIKSRFEAELVVWNGKKIWVELSNSFIELDNQKVLLSIFRDITERKNFETNLLEAKTKAEEMSRLKSNFLANMSHELRTPLIGILGYAEILSETTDDNSIKDMSEVILKGGKRLSETLNLILDLSKIEANKMEIKYKSIDIELIIGEVINLFTSLVNKKGLYLNFLKPKEKFIAKLDERMIRDIFNNIINNAVKYTNFGGITVELKRAIEGSKQYIVVNVTDTGIGIKKENLEIIFDEFRQESEGLSRAYEGTGLGLTITKKFVELMDGEIHVQSTFGIGSTFTVKFSLEKVELHKEEVRRQYVTTRETIADLRNKHLPLALLIDDDDIAHSVCEKFLTNICELDHARESETAVKRTNQKDYDFILLDINLGFGKNGLEVMKEIKKREYYNSVPIVALTAYAMVGDKEKFINAGCTHYISKPFIKNEFIEAIENIIKELK